MFYIISMSSLRYINELISIQTTQALIQGPSLSVQWLWSKTQQSLRFMIVHRCRQSYGLGHHDPL